MSRWALAANPQELGSESMFPNVPILECIPVILYKVRFPLSCVQTR